MRLLQNLRSFKCNTCKAVLVASPYDNSFVWYDGQYFCVECLIKKRTSTRTKKDRWQPEEANEKIKILINQTQKHLHSIVSKDALYDYLDAYYSPSFVPKKFYEKMASIFDGTYKGLKVPVPPEDLLDMLQQKQSYLEKQAIKKWGDNPPEPMSRINYDIAIVISRYDRYLAWRNEKEAEQKALEQQLQSQCKVQTATHTPKPQQNNKKETEIDISKLIDELFD